MASNFKSGFSSVPTVEDEDELARMDREERVGNGEAALSALCAALVCAPEPGMREEIQQWLTEVDTKRVRNSGMGGKRGS